MSGTKPATSCLEVRDTDHSVNDDVLIYKIYDLKGGNWGNDEKN